MRTKHWVAINDDARGKYNTSSKIEFRTSMLKLSFCDYSDSCILAKGTISVTKTASAGAAISNGNIKIVLHILIA